MGKKLYIGNLDYSVTDKQLEEHFSPYGEVLSVNVIKDRYTGQSRGYAFVELSTAGEAENAKAALNEKELNGRILKVDESRERPRTERGRGGYGGRDGDSNRRSYSDRGGYGRY